MKSIKTFNTLAAAFALSLAASHSALAGDASGDLDIEAGLGEAIALNCDTVLSFGITTVGIGDRGGDTTVSVNKDTGEATAGGQTANVTTGTESQAGVCELTGSEATDGSQVTVTIGSADVADATATLGGSTNTETFSTENAGDLTGLEITAFDVTGEPDLQGGEATINIGGTLTIPDGLASSDMGGYTTTVTVTASDNLGP